MPDKTLTITSFKYGLDARRSDLVSLPGTLANCVNAHINPGGEVEKRKAFVPDPKTFPTNTFGIQDVAQGIMCFGSDASPNGQLPAGVIYQQLQSPTNSKMTAVVASTNYQGKAFVIAQFTDMRILFYNGVVIDQSWIGTVHPGLEHYTDQSTELAKAISALPGWLASANLAVDGVSFETGSTIVKSPAGISFISTLASTFAGGPGGDSGFGAQNLNDTQPTGVVGVNAVAAFNITNFGAGTFEINAPANPDGTGVAHLSGITTIPGGGTLQAAAQILINAINNNTITTGYTAIADVTPTTQGNVFVFAPEPWGAKANGFQLTINVTGLSAYGPSTQLYLNPIITITPNPIVDAAQTQGDAPFSVNGTAKVKGGIPPLAFQWVEVVGGQALAPGLIGPSGMTIINDTHATCTFSRIVPGPVTSVQGRFRCTVTDSRNISAAAAVIVIMTSF